MFCPECKAEYRQGFTHCVDCDVDLVHELPQEPYQASSVPATEESNSLGEDLRLIWKGVEENECVAICRDLRKNGIVYRVAQIPEWYELKMRSRLRYEIGVAHADYEGARDLLRIEGEFWDAYSSEDEAVATEAGLGAISLPPDNSPPGEKVRNASYLQPWYPEDAIAEVWSQDGADFSGLIEMALKENLIHCRLDRQDRISKIFVMSEDEPRAREIVRQIAEGLAPE